MATNPSSRSRGLQQQSSSSGGPNGRHNLFSSTLSRRPSGNPSTSASTTTVHSSNTENQEAADIVVRDEHGNYRLDLPRMTPIPRDEASEEQEAENRLIETYMKHQQHIEPNELKATLQASLQAKVASLDDDKWMFEKDDGLPQ